MPPILSTSHCEFYGTRLCAHARKIILLVPIHLFTRQIVPLVCEELLTLSSSISVMSNFCNSHTKSFLSSKKFLRGRRFFFLLFSCHTFRGLALYPWHESRNLYLKHSFSTYTCLSDNSLISAWISTNFVSTLLLCKLYQTNNFSA